MTVKMVPPWKVLLMPGSVGGSGMGGRTVRAVGPCQVRPWMRLRSRAMGWTGRRNAGQQQDDHAEDKRHRLGSSLRQ
jgi:hypothetical protein